MVCIEMMELPAELVKAVREFNSPRCESWRDYRNALKVTGRYEWPVLLQKLCEPDATQLLPLLKDYLEAFTRRKNADEEYDRYTSPSRHPHAWVETRELQMSWLEQQRLRKECRDTQWYQDAAFRDLMIAMLGEETVDREQMAYVDADYDPES
jgi:hypothetical protein